jgi:hypothetical protein
LIIAIVRLSKHNLDAAHRTATAPAASVRVWESTG